MDAAKPKELRGERGPPPHFAGRVSELALLGARLDAVLADPGAAKDGMLLLTGVPGVGKTHLMEHFARQVQDDRRVVVLPLSPVDLAAPEGLLLLIGKGLGARDQFARAAGIDDKVSGIRGNVAGVVTAGVTMDAYRPGMTFSHMLRATRNLTAWKRKVLVVTIDEVQDVDSRSADQLQTLHLGLHECPVLAVAAGLQHSKSVLSDMGISRTSHRQLTLLTTQETVEAIYHGLRNIGVDVSEATAGRFAEAAMRFPQHVHGHIEAARDVFRERGEVDSPDAVAKVLERGGKSREDYYVGRMSAMGRANRLYPLVEHMEGGAAQSVTLEQAEAVVGADAVAAAVRHGVMTEGEDGVLSFGIPSFHSYMVRRAAEHRQRTGSGLSRPTVDAG